MFAHGIARSGYIQIPSTSDLAFEFLPVSWTSIQHYGVNVGTLRYNGDGLTDFRNKRSPYLGRRAGKWPIRYNPDDASAVWFHNPDTAEWHRLEWEHTRKLAHPFSFEAVGYAKRLACALDRFPDTVGALDDLLGRWNVGLGTTPAERRMALRLATQRAALELPSPQVTTLPSVRAPLAGTDDECSAEQLLQPHLVVEVGEHGPPAPPPPVSAAADEAPGESQTATVARPWPNPQRSPDATDGDPLSQLGGVEPDRPSLRLDPALIDRWSADTVLSGRLHGRGVR